MPNLQIYKASAGSGKTYTLALEYIKELILNCGNEGHRRILAVTFTKDATGEMKDRILAELYGLAFETADSTHFLHSLKELLARKGNQLNDREIRDRAGRALRQILHDYSHLNITTIDSFFQRVLRNLARELGASSRFNLEMNTQHVLSDAVHAVIANALPNTPTLEWLTTYVENKLDEDKSWNVEKEIFDFSKCIYDEHFQQHEAALLKQLASNPNVFNQLHKQQQDILRTSRKVFEENGRRYLSLLDSNGLEVGEISNGSELPKLFNKLNKDSGAASLSARMHTRMVEAKAWATQTSKRKNEIISLAERGLMPLLRETADALKAYKTASMIMKNLHQLGLVRDISNEISSRNKELNRFMLSDTSLFLNQMIDGSDTPFIYEKLGAEIRHIMIDEFQDTSRLQWENFKVLLTDILASDNFSLLVGDVKQSIYRWRNGDWRILNGIEEELGASSEVLPKNYRSEKAIVDFNNALFREAGRILDGMFTALTELSPSPFSKAYSEKEVIQTAHKQSESGFVSIDFIDRKDNNDTSYNERMSAALVDKLCLLHEKGIKARDVCILARKNDQIVALGNHLASIRENYPQLADAHYLDLVSNDAFRLNSSLAVKIIIEALRSIAAPEDKIARAQLESFLSAVGGITATDKLQDLERELGVLGRMPLFELINHIYLLFSLGDIPGQSPYLFTLQDALITYLQDDKSGLADFLLFWDEELSQRSIPAGEGMDGVRAMTIHKSKGLQFDTVIVPYCDWKLSPAIPPIVWCSPKPGFYDLELLPITYHKGMGETIFRDEYYEETIQSWMDNLNLMYVAFTRAERNLLVLAEERKKFEEPSIVSDMLRLTVERLCGQWDGERLYTQGSLTPPSDRKEAKSQGDNPLKETPPSLSVDYAAYRFDSKKSIFKQSNQSYEFLYPDRPSKNRYVAYGNVMHKLFETINTVDDIGKAVDRQVSEGNIHPDERSAYVERISKAIGSLGQDWFSGKYTVFNECTILTEENGEVIAKRPDRVLLSADETKVIDFKFGRPRKEYAAQIQDYLSLLRSMNYPHVQGYIWYVEEEKMLVY